MEVSKNIRSVRERLGLTQVDVAKRLGTERSNYARLENRDTNLTIKQVEEIAVALGVPVSDLLGITDYANTAPDQSELIQRLETQAKTWEDIARAKKRDIRFYKQVLEWIRDKFNQEFLYSKLAAAEIQIPDSDSELTLESYETSFSKLSDLELKAIGDKLFDSGSALIFISDFLASSGFITEKWFIDAYKRAARRQGNKVSPSEAINYVQSAFNFINEEN